MYKTEAERMPYGKVLIVDDVETNLYATQELLERYHLDITALDCGFKAIQRIQKGNFYDIIFMEHMLSYIDGIETTKKLRAMGYRGIIIALTADMTEGNEKLFLQNIFDDFILKPIDAAQVDMMLNLYIYDKNDGVLPSVPDADSMFFEVFTRDVNRIIGVLKKTARGDDLTQFVRAAHSIKSALAYIGNGKLFAHALELERAGLVGDRVYIDERLGGFVVDIGAFAESLASL